jgi:hypothetical protein
VRQAFLSAGKLEACYLLNRKLRSRHKVKIDNVVKLIIKCQFLPLRKMS